jgi:hypothetical protein
MRPMSMVVVAVVVSTVVHCIVDSVPVLFVLDHRDQSENKTIE